MEYQTPFKPLFAMLTQLFQFDIRLEVVVRRPSYNVYDGRDTTCTTVVVHVVW